MPSAEVSPEEKELQDVLNISVATAEAEETQRRIEELQRLEESQVWEVVPSDKEVVLVFYNTKERAEEETTATPPQGHGGGAIDAGAMRWADLADDERFQW